MTAAIPGAPGELGALLSELQRDGVPTVELRRTARRDLQDTLVAMANASGGRVVLGVTETAPYRLVGLASPAQVREHVDQAVAAIHPPLSVSTEILAVGNDHVAVLTMAPCHPGFAQTSDGRLLLRSGNKNRVLIGADLVRFVNDATGVPVEDTVVSSASLSDLDRTAVLDYLRRRGGEGVQAHDIGGALTDLGLAVSRRPTLACLLLFGQQPQRFHRYFGISYARYAGAREAEPELRETREFGGRLPDAVAAAAELITAGPGAYPEAVVREALFNAVGHRDYRRDGDPVRVRQYDDAVEFVSPGALPVAVDIEDLPNAAYSRNRRIIGLFRDLGQVAAVGDGVDLMATAMRDDLLDPPEIAQDADNVTLRLSAHSLASAQERIWLRELGEVPSGRAGRFAVVLTRRHGAVSNAELRAAGGLSVAESRRTLRTLVDAGLLAMSGVGRTTRYQFAGADRP